MGKMSEQITDTYLWCKQFMTDYQKKYKHIQGAEVLYSRCCEIAETMEKAVTDLEAAMLPYAKR